MIHIAYQTQRKCLALQAFLIRNIAEIYRFGYYIKIRLHYDRG